MDKADPILEDVSALGQFVNLQTAGVKEFKDRYPDFLPPIAWILAGDSENALWQVYQTFVKRLWRTGFTTEKCLAVVFSINSFTFNQDLFEKANEEIPGAGALPPSEMVWPDKTPHIWERIILSTQVWTIQKAILLVNRESWRAQFCNVCGKPFAIIALNNTHRQANCGDLCAAEAKRRKHARHREKKKTALLAATVSRGIRGNHG